MLSIGYRWVGQLKCIIAIIEIWDARYVDVHNNNSIDEICIQREIQTYMRFSRDTYVILGPKRNSQEDNINHDTMYEARPR